MEYLTYVKLPAYEREWCETHFGKPCEFTRGTNLNSIIRHFMRKRPDNAPPEIRQPGETAIVLVSSASKKVETYNYISKPGKEAIAKADRLCKKLRQMTLPPTNENMDLEVWRAL